jgi:D-citramalate synthase
MSKVQIEIMDTTLRDGEQTSGVSFMPHEKLMIARALLQSLKVDRIEIASARVSEGEENAVRNICRWAQSAGYIDRVEVLGFVDGTTSIDWIRRCGCRTINLLCKGSLSHCVNQLRKSPEQHIADIIQSVDYATRNGVAVNVYLEDWSNGMKNSPDYVFQLVDALRQTTIRRFMLPDTLGVLNPLQLINYMRRMKKRYPDLHFDFHAHNDYDLAISNVLAAVLAGCRGIHTSVNGLGERAASMRSAAWSKATPALPFRPTAPSPATAYSRKWQVCTPTATIKPTSTATTSCPSASAENASMPSARTAAKPTSSKTSKSLASN